jgi:DNA polymerase III subunit gamma/tau
MGPCEPGQVGNEAAISSSFQVRGLLIRDRQREKIRNSNVEIRKKFKLRRTNVRNRLAHSVFGFRACFGFRHSDFGFGLTPMPPSDSHPDPSPSYVVVARRYRPQAFGELIGQEHVSQALSNAIATHRVGHAYLFTGARGTGKTSTARIFAKALNCVKGPTAAPCNECDICLSISRGDDVDVLEIDGASNRGIDEIRQLRQNVNVRPSRARFKIYIIDEVHMLTREAFNALLKTLEEPPEHVKFLFCTTEANKIPITILSRCQRYDFAGISTRSIFERLKQICEAEGVQAEDEALEALARRAAGSMRDSQSLLEQLLSFASERITVAEVHGMLGTAGDQRLAALAKHLVDRNSAAALSELDAAGREGVDVAQFIEQLFGYFRDCMVAAAGCPADTFLYVSTSHGGEVADAARRLGLQTVLAAMQILDQTLARMRYSTQSRILAELALVRICSLEDLDELSGLIAQLQEGQPLGANGKQGAASAQRTGSEAHPTTAKKKYEPAAEPHGAEVQSPSQRPAAAPVASSNGGPDDDDDTPAGADFALDAANMGETWRRALEKVPGMVGEQAKKFHRLEISGINRLTVCFAPEHSMYKTACHRPEQTVKFERALKEVTGQTIRVEFKVLTTEPVAAGPEAPARPVNPHQRLLEAAGHPMVRRAGELFGAQPMSVEEG